MKLSKSIVGFKELVAISKVILGDSYLGMGKQVNQFENDLSNYLNIDRKNVICVNSGTAALHIALTGIINKGDEVLVPSLTYVASYQAIIAAGGIPISCDINENTFNISIIDAESKLTSNTKVIMPVHYASNPSGLDEVYHFAKKNNLRIIEDAAHAFGCKFNDKLIGSFGDIICFSFDGIKNITSGEGGAIISFDDNESSLFRDYRLLSVEKDTENRFSGTRSWDFDVKKIGYRYHMSNIFAAIGIVQLKKFNSSFSQKRRKLFYTYKSNLEKNKYVIFPQIDENIYIVPHILSIRVTKSINDLKNEFEKENIPYGIHYKPNHFLSLFKVRGLKLPVIESIYNELITLPLHPEIKIKDVNKICSIINKIIK